MAESLLSTTLPSNTIRPEWPRHEISTVFCENNNIKATLEDVYYNNNIILSGQSTAFSSTNSFKLTKAYHFIRNIVLQLGVSVNANPGFYNDYVGHSMIDNIKFQVDSTELLQIQGYSLVDIMNENCESQFQKDKFLELSGYKELGIGTNTQSGGVPPFLTNLYVPLILPFATIEPGKINGEKAFPLYLVPGHIELLVQLRNSASIFQAVGAVTITSVSLLVNYGKIGNFSQMAKLCRFPTRQYINTQRILIPNNTNNGIAGNSMQISLTSFRRAELTNLLLRWCPTSDNAGTYYNFYDGDEISSLNVLFNGVQIWSNNNTSDPIWDVLSGEQPSYMGFKRQVLRLATGADGVVNGFTQYFVNSTSANANETFTKIDAPMSSGTVSVDFSFFGNNSALQSSNAAVTNLRSRENRYYNINFSEIRANMMCNNDYSLGFDLSKQTLNLQMTFPKYNGTSFGGQLYITFVYNSIYQFEENQSAILAF